jgi:hypothetical protein
MAISAHHAVPHAGRTHSTVREGIIVGVLGAVAVAVWFLIVDSIGGRPLHTPALLGALVTRAANPMAAADGSGKLMLAAAYTPIHFILFVLFGMLVVFLLHRAEKMPSLLMLALLLFAAFEVGFTGVVVILEQTALGDLAWYQVAVGNLIAVVVMAWYLVRRHSGLEGLWRHSLD